MKIKVIHIDDQQSAIDDAFQVIKNLEQVEYLGGFTEFDSALELMKRDIPDMVLLDIELGNSESSAFDLIHELPPSVQIVFLTGFENYAVKSYGIKATDYIMKPATENEIRTAIDLVRKNIILKNVLSVSDMLRDFSEHKQNVANRLQINTAGRQYFEPFDEIEYVMADGSYTNFHKTDGSVITSGKILKTYKGSFTDHENFVEVSRSAIINRNFLKIILREKHKISAEMKSGARLEISQLRKDEILKKLSNF